MDYFLYAPTALIECTSVVSSLLMCSVVDFSYYDLFRMLSTANTPQKFITFFCSFPKKCALFYLHRTLQRYVVSYECLYISMSALETKKWKSLFSGTLFSKIMTSDAEIQILTMYSWKSLYFMNRYTNHCTLTVSKYKNNTICTKCFTLRLHCLRTFMIIIFLGVKTWLTFQ